MSHCYVPAWEGSRSLLRNQAMKDFRVSLSKCDPLLLLADKKTGGQEIGGFIQNACSGRDLGELEEGR